MKIILSLLLVLLWLIGCSSSGTANQSGRFSDVEKSAWYAESVQYVTSHGLMNGIGDSRFDPDGLVTRGMLVTILYRMDGSPTIAGRSPFTDVDANSYYSDAVSWASAHSIVNGYTQTRFGPGYSITREQLATILYRFSLYHGYDVSRQASLSAFSDTNDICSYAVQAMRWAVSVGIINGVENTLLGPQMTATRAQVATIIMRYDSTDFSVGDASPEIPEPSLPPVNPRQVEEDNGEPMILVDNVSATAGKKDVTLTISIKNNPGILGMTLTLTYDDEVLTLKNAENGFAVRDALTMTKPGKFQSPCRFMWDGQEVTPEETKDGVILTLTFEVAENASFKTYPIRVSYIIGDIVDNNLAEICPTIRDGSIIIY